MFGAVAPIQAAPNVLLIVADDLGYGDLGCYGSTTIRTPHLDQLAAEGARFTDFYAASPVCSASRAALFSGKYPITLGIDWVISAESDVAIPHETYLLPERMRDLGYDTALFGKWHLGNAPENWPTAHGFRRWFGTIGSNDMGRGKPSLEARRSGKAGVELVDATVVGGEPTIELNPDQSLLTQRTTDRAIEYLDLVEGRSPFFLCVTYNMPHTPLFAGPEFVGKSEAGLYGDVIEEIDHSVGRLVEALGESKDHTLILFTSDNGPWLIFGNHGGSAAPLSGGKKQTLEGGLRVPLIARWPERIPRYTVVTEPTTALDLTPTIATLAGGDIELDEELDGRVLERFAEEPIHLETLERAPFFYLQRKRLVAVREGDWKYRRAHLDPEFPDPAAIGQDGERGSVMRQKLPAALFNLRADPAERTNLIENHPDRAAALEATIAAAEKTLTFPNPTP